MKRFLALMLALVMVLSMSVGVFADSDIEHLDTFNKAWVGAGGTTSIEFNNSMITIDDGETEFPTIIEVLGLTEANHPSYTYEASLFDDFGEMFTWVIFTQDTEQETLEVNINNKMYYFVSEAKHFAEDDLKTERMIEEGYFTPEEKVTEIVEVAVEDLELYDFGRQYIGSWENDDLLIKIIGVEATVTDKANGRLMFTFLNTGVISSNVGGTYHNYGISNNGMQDTLLLSKSSQGGVEYLSFGMLGALTKVDDTSVLAVEPITPIVAPVVTVDEHVITDINMKIFANGNEVNFTGVGPVNVDGSTMIPVRAVFEALGMTVGWDAETKSVLIHGDDVRYTDGSYYDLIITLGLEWGYASNDMGEGEVELSTPAMLVNGSTVLPLRDIAEYYGYVITWSDEGTHQEINIEVSK